eukprot:1156026-Pelagomonas_calceolata.AAC.7
MGYFPGGAGAYVGQIRDCRKGTLYPLLPALKDKASLLVGNKAHATLRRHSIAVCETGASSDTGASAYKNT